MRWLTFLPFCFLPHLTLSIPQYQHVKRSALIADTIPGPTDNSSPAAPKKHPMDQAKELALFLGFTATTGLAAMPLHDQAHKVLKTQHGRVLKQLDEIIPRRNAKYWCMRDCVYDQVLHHSPEPTFIQAYATCQKPDRCDLRDPIYIHFPHKEETQTSSGAKSSSKAGQTDGQQPIKDFVGRVAGGFRRGVSNGAKRAKDTLSKSVGIVENVQRKNGGGGSGGMKGFTGPVGIPRPGFVIR